MERYVGIDIGGTSIKYGVLDECGNILEKSSMDTEAEKGGGEILRKVVQIVSGYTGACSLSGVCISTAGMVDCEKGEIFFSGDLIPDYTGVQLKKVVEETFDIPCEVENDVNCAGFAEYKTGAAQGSKVALCLTIGTGIGGSAVINGEIFHGGSNSALEIGYLCMEDSDFQTLGAASVLSKKVALEKGGTPEAWNGVQIFEQAKAGDAVCERAIDEMCEVLGKGIANICYVLNPDVIVLGGGIMAQKEMLRPKITKELEKYLKPVIFEHTRLEFAAHKNDAGILGAFYHFKNRNNKKKCERQAERAVQG